VTVVILDHRPIKSVEVPHQVAAFCRSPPSSSCGAPSTVESPSACKKDDERAFSRAPPIFAVTRQRWDRPQVGDAEIDLAGARLGHHVRCARRLAPKLKYHGRARPSKAHSHDQSRPRQVVPSESRPLHDMRADGGLDPGHCASVAPVLDRPPAFQKGWRSACSSPTTTTSPISTDWRRSDRSARRMFLDHPLAASRRARVRATRPDGGHPFAHDRLIRRAHAIGLRVTLFPWCGWCATPQPSGAACSPPRPAALVSRPTRGAWSSSRSSPKRNTSRCSPSDRSWYRSSERCRGGVR